jgi:hypothetical protein
MATPVPMSTTPRIASSSVRSAGPARAGSGAAERNSSITTPLRLSTRVTTIGSM